MLQGGRHHPDAGPRRGHAEGRLHNPYNDQIAASPRKGHKKYLGPGCNGCHGGGGGGGMCPPLTNDTWVYGRDDDTLFRLVALGSAGYKRRVTIASRSEIVVGPMPPFGGIIKTSDDLWKIIALIRSVNPGSLKPAAAAIASLGGRRRHAFVEKPSSLARLGGFS